MVQHHMQLLYAGSSALNENVESSMEGSGGAPATSPNGDSEIQLEPTQSEMERERLMSRAEQVSPTSPCIATNQQPGCEEAGLDK